ncbi:uncharacterized protein LOC124944974 [Impatiens glandulifera]|uniref:uncharacterized protein LOC124944974 n=1 Tax=Impatiens glandulifera TaxID=253017 RepID=UPI001FB07936|nr:uncharacterized protein LOC124944974 [Impatiens glandulifera]
MAFKKQASNWLPVLFIVFQFIYHVLSQETTKVSWDLNQQGIVKTIETDNGEIIDCIDIYKQPSLANSLITDLQMEPSYYPFGNNFDSNLTIEMLQDWHKDGECPESTIPYSVVTNEGSSYYRASGVFNLWNPKTEDNEFSLSQIWVVTSYDKLDGWLIQ